MGVGARDGAETPARTTRRFKAMGHALGEAGLGARDRVDKTPSRFDIVLLLEQLSANENN